MRRKEVPSYSSEAIHNVELRGAKELKVLKHGRERKGKYLHIGSKLSSQSPTAWLDEDDENHSCAPIWKTEVADPITLDSKGYVPL